MNMSKVKDAISLLKVAKDLTQKLKGETSASLRFDCMNNLGICTITIHVGNAFAKWVTGLLTNLQFSLYDVYDVEVYELKPTLRKIREAVIQDESNFIVDFSKCLNSEMLRFIISYRMQEDFLHTLVHQRSSPEPFGDETKYHLSAQLTDPESLVFGFSEVDIEEFPVTARIYVKENIDTVIPSLDYFKELRRIEHEMLSDYDPHHGIKMMSLQKRRHELRNKILQENPQEAFRALINLLRPLKFQTYLSVEQDFRLQKCVWGIEQMELPGSVYLPENMDVIVRTDLRIDKPTSRGLLHYKGGQFSRDVQEALSR